MGRILVVDDEAGLRGMLEVVLRRDGHQVTQAGSGEQALRALAADPGIELVLTDLRMEPMDGLGLLAAIRAKHADVFVVIMTAFADWSTAVRAMRLGAYNFLSKPFDNAMVRSLVARALHARDRHLAARSAGEHAGVVQFVGTSRPIQDIQQLIEQGAFWHTGIVVCTAGRALETLAERTPELEMGLPALAAGKLDRFAGLVQSVSIERGLLERLPDLVVLPVDCGWDDVGTWSALRRVRELDDTGNGVWGPAHLVDASSCVVHAEEQTTVLYGLTGMLVVSRPGLTFVTTLDRAAELRPLLDALPEQVAGRTTRREGGL